MPTTFRRYSPNQATLLPPSPADWLEQGHLVHFVSDLIDQLDLRPFYAPYEGDGRRNSPYDPRMMLKVIVYGYLTGTFSSRQIQKRVVEDIGMRYLAGENGPKYRALAEFRVRHLQAFASLLAQVIGIAEELKLIGNKRVAIDGTKIRANASKRKAMSYGRMKKTEAELEREVAELLERAAQEDAAEDAEFGPDHSGQEVREELRRREDRLEKIRDAKRRVEERQRQADKARGRDESADGKPKNLKRAFGVPNEKAQDNFTDPESRIMLTSNEGFQQGYNAQIAVDAQAQIIVGTAITQAASDTDLLVPMIEQVEEQLGAAPQEVLADAGYKSEANFDRLEQKGVRGYVALKRERKGGASYERAGEGPATRRMNERMKSDQGRTIYARRKCIVEPVFGWIKQAIGFRKFSLRGLSNVMGEWNLICFATNLKRLHVLTAAA